MAAVHGGRRVVLATASSRLGLGAVLLAGLLGAGCESIGSYPAQARITCSLAEPTCPDGFYCNVDHQECRRPDCPECGADERCVDGLCVDWRGCDLRSEPGCTGCDCEQCVCDVFPSCCHEFWGEQCVSQCRLCRGCGAPPLEPCQGDACPAIEWIRLPGGTYEMGPVHSSLPVARVETTRTVTLDAFEISKTEVTVAQFAPCVESGYCIAPRSGGLGDYCNWGQGGLERHPINCITWHQARTFAEWVGARLPSEAEWEYAARSGGLLRTYPWGDEEVTCERAIVYKHFREEGDWGFGCGLDSTAEVCSRPLGNSEQGVCDLVGNVEEWLEDDYHGELDCELAPEATNCEDGGAVPSDGSAWVDEPRRTTRVNRGCNFFYDPEECAWRYLYPYPHDYSFSLGLRLVRPVQR